MSESTIKKKLVAAYSKAGRILGREYNMYRPAVLDDSLSMQNFLRKQWAAFTVSDSFVQAQPEGFKEHMVYTNHGDVQRGDIFDDCGETFVVAWNRGLEHVMAIKATQLVEVLRPTWSTSGGLQSVRTRIARSVPASVVRNSSVTDVSVSNVQQTSQFKRWDIRIVADDGDIVQTDNIKFSNGTILHIDSIKVTEQYLILTCSEMTSDS